MEMRTPVPRVSGRRALIAPALLFLLCLIPREAQMGSFPQFVVSNRDFAVVVQGMFGEMPNREAYEKKYAQVEQSCRKAGQRVLGALATAVKEARQDPDLAKILLDYDAKLPLLTGKDDAQPLGRPPYATAVKPGKPFRWSLQPAYETTLYIWHQAGGIEFALAARLNKKQEERLNQILAPAWAKLQATAEREHLLHEFDQVADLLAMARRDRKDPNQDVFALQDALRADFLKRKSPFKYTIAPTRVDACSTSMHQVPDFKYILVKPGKGPKSPAIARQVEITEKQLHEIREHGADFSAEQKKFLLNWHFD
jgi:hypothetical protein